MRERNAECVSLTPPPGFKQVLWALALIMGGVLGTAAGGFGLAYLANLTDIPATNLLSA